MKKIYVVVALDDSEKVVWRGPATDLKDAERKASVETGLPVDDILAWEDREER